MIELVLSSRRNNIKESIFLSVRAVLNIPHLDWSQGCQVSRFGRETQGYLPLLTTGVTFLTDFFVGLTLLSDQTPQWFKNCSGYRVPYWTHSIPLHCLWQPLAQTCCTILRDHRRCLAWDRVYLFECLFSFKMTSPSKVVDVTASPVAKTTWLKRRKS